MIGTRGAADVVCYYHWQHMAMTDLDKRIQTLAQWMFGAKRVVVFSGAGISTESGLPDFRGPDGIWTRRAKGLPANPRQFDSAEPNPGHMAIVELQKLGRLDFLISQNVDNLHLKSGIKPDLLAELHGNISKLRCERCQTTYDKSSGLNTCPCGGSLVNSVVNFGQSLPQRDLAAAYWHSERCDLFVVVGSSLVVCPAADMPRVALEAGAKLVIINKGETPYDSLVHLRFDEQIGRVLPPAIAKLKRLIQG